MRPKETLAMRMHELACTRSFLHMYTGLILRTNSNFQKTIQDMFFAFMLRFGMNPISPRDHSKPLFSHYKKPYMV